MAIQDAKKIYGMIAEAKNETDKPETNSPSAGQAQQAPGSYSPVTQPYVPPLLTKGKVTPARNAARAEPRAAVLVEDMPPGVPGYLRRWLNRL